MALLHEVGLAESGAGGPSPLSPTQLAAWSAGTGYDLMHWEFRALLLASKSFVNAVNDENAEMPEALTGFNPPSVASQFRAIAQFANKATAKK